MILLLDTSTATCKLTLLGESERYEHSWLADRSLAKGLLGFLDEQLRSHDKTFDDLTGIGVFKGPGSFTGLRIGLTVANTIADAQGISIVGETGELWQKHAVTRLKNGESDVIVLPFYGSDARITKPRK